MKHYLKPYNNNYFAMKDLKRLSLLLLIVLGIFIGCSKDDVPENEAPALTQKINLFMKDAMENFYLWNYKLPNIDYRSESNSLEYFDKLLYKDDKWSIATDDVEGLSNSIEGIETSYGWSLVFGKFTDSEDRFALVEFVYPFTPASEAGISRGDFIVLINGNPITVDNYKELYDSQSAQFSMATIGEDGDLQLSGNVDLVARKLALNPVAKTSVVEHDGHKIGYILYNQFIDSYNFAIDTALENMISNNITDLVIDLRYNPGGHITAAQHLCSSLAPLPNVNNNDVLVKFHWNEDWQEYFEESQQTQRLHVYLDHEVPVKMGLSHIHFITSEGSASASELTITGLKPYMDNVVLVGDTTYGKYTGSQIFTPEDIYKDEDYTDEINNWAILPVIFRYANSAGVTDFKDGFAPDYLVEDDFITPLGTKEEALFKVAIEDITGSPVIAMKSAKKLNLSYTIFDRGFSKFDRNKRGLLLNNIEFDFKK